MAGVILNDCPCQSQHQHVAHKVLGIGMKKHGGEKPVELGVPHNTGGYHGAFFKQICGHRGCYNEDNDIYDHQPEADIGALVDTLLSLPEILPGYICFLHRTVPILYSDIRSNS